MNYCIIHFEIINFRQNVMIALTPMYEDFCLRDATPGAVDVSTQDVTSIDVKKGGR